MGIDLPFQIYHLPGIVAFGFQRRGDGRIIALLIAPAQLQLGLFAPGGELVINAGFY